MKAIPFFIVIQWTDNVFQPALSGKLNHIHLKEKKRKKDWNLKSSRMDKCQSFVQKFIATVGTNENLKGHVIKKQTKKNIKFILRT